MAGGTSANYIAEWNGGKWNSVYSGTNDTVRALVPAGNVVGVIVKGVKGSSTYAVALLAGGSFTQAGGSTSPYVALYFPVSVVSYPSGWYTVSGLTKPVYSVASSMTNNYVGGIFDTVTGGMWRDTMQVNYIAQFTFVVGGGFNELNNNRIVNIYPNPSNGIFNYELRIKNYESENMEVYNVLGEKVYSQYAILNTQFSIDLSNQPAGIYLYRITDKDGALIRGGKLVIEK